MNDEDRAWLDSDLSRLGEYPPYELTEEQLAGEQPITYMPGVGLVVLDDGPIAEDGWLRGAPASSAFEVLRDPKEYVYSPEDGEPFRDEGDDR